MVFLQAGVNFEKRTDVRPDIWHPFKHSLLLISLRSREPISQVPMPDEWNHLADTVNNIKK